MELNPFPKKAPNVTGVKKDSRTRVIGVRHYLHINLSSPLLSYTSTFDSLFCQLFDPSAQHQSTKCETEIDKPVMTRIR